MLFVHGADEIKRKKLDTAVLSFYSISIIFSQKLYKRHSTKSHIISHLIRHFIRHLIRHFIRHLIRHFIRHFIRHLIRHFIRHFIIYLVGQYTITVKNLSQKKNKVYRNHNINNLYQTHQYQ